MSSSDTPGLKAGSWSLWCIGMVTIICRLASRRLLFGSFKKYQLDDCLMILCAVSFTGVVVSSNQVAINGSNYAPDTVIAQWSPQEKSNAQWGSKMLLALEEFMLATVWLVKACLLLLYSRMTAGLTEGLAVKIVAIYCAFGYVLIQILYLGVWCRPIHDYWAVPVPDDHPQCRSYHNHMITVTAFHVSSDLLMLLIPVPMIARAHLPLGRKIILCVVFSLGLLVVLVAILNRYYNFTESNSLVFLIWYNGEASTAVMIANIPFCWTLLRRVFSLDAWGGSKKWTRASSGLDDANEGVLGLRNDVRHPTLIGVRPDDGIEMVSRDCKGQTASQSHTPVEDSQGHNVTRIVDSDLDMDSDYRKFGITERVDAHRDK